jgi:glycosyltransferase 2 family protein
MRQRHAISRPIVERQFPSGSMVLLLIGLGIVDLSATALAMYVLIPAEMNIGVFRAIAVFIAGI